MKLNLRFIRQTDLGAVVEMERLANQVMDQPDLLQPWTLGAEGVLEVIRQRRDEARGTYDTRTMVVEGITEAPGNPNQIDTRIVACFAYELQPDGYELLFCLLHPSATAESVLKLIGIYLIGKANRSPVRRKVLIYLRDRDEAGLRTLLPFWTKQGFEQKLVPDHFGNTDAWRLLFESDVPTTERDKHDDDKKSC